MATNLPRWIEDIVDRVADLMVMQRDKGIQRVEPQQYPQPAEPGQHDVSGTSANFLARGLEADIGISQVDPRHLTQSNKR